MIEDDDPVDETEDVELPGEPTQPIVPMNEEPLPGRQPWQLTTADKRAFDERCAMVRLPYRDAHFPTLFNRDQASDFRIKSAHWFVFLGPVGVWLMLGCTSLSPVIRDLICDSLWWCHRITAKSFDHDELAVLEAEGYELFAKLEIRLPLRTASIARHYLSHACWFIRQFGPLHTHWQLILT